MELLFFVFGLGAAIASAVLADRKNRSAVNWFFLSAIWGVIGLIILACAKTLDKDKYESDTIAKVLWTIVIIPIVLVFIMILVHKLMF